uniref:Uncharacterized protein n=1 Tax=Siphoviridae sp. ctwQT14 TaxID=2827971 RepID=A0A8S5TJU3_9CAUD|nr:MAG TPA: hypothetical protein [Siphoviridae sp. ctwQT14]
MFEFCMFVSFLFSKIHAKSDHIKMVALKYI